MMQTFTTVIHKEENQYVAECTEVGTVSQGENIEEAINNLKEATGLYLDEFPLKEERKTLMTTFEVAISAKA
ncbi:putative nuclease of the RNAse H fold, HicB family [Candidatus Methanophagaceae archaeon]|nr:putative nuclease of the RNAse H fold, HicB family [Methanophagales archaeon]